jgi:predicted  nucleic acid-binding Zn-ribbon protein
VGEKERLEEKMKELEREKKAGEKKITQLQTKMSKATSDLKEEREVSYGIILSVLMGGGWDCRTP